MATSQTHTGNGSTLSYDITFPFIKSSDVKVSVAGTTKSSPSDYTITGTTVIFGSAPANSAAIKIWRATDVSEATHLYSPGSIITATSLNDNLRQLLYAIEENKNDTLATGQALTWSNSQAKNHIMAKDDTDWVIQDSVIDGDMLKDDIITAGKIVGNAVGAAELANNSVDAGAISSNAVTTAKILDHNVTYGKLQDVSTDHRLLGRDHNTNATVAEVQVATDHIVDDAVTYPKLQNIATANRVLGRASAGEVQEVQVATDMIVDNAITHGKMASSRIFGKYAILEDVKSFGTGGQDLVQNQWDVRDLNTIYTNPDSIVSALDTSTSQFTLIAGTYFIRWNSIFYRTQETKTRLYNVTDSSSVKASMNQYIWEHESASSHGYARFTISGSKAFRIEYQVDAEADADSGGGRFSTDLADTDTEDEIYTTVEIYKEL